MKKKVIVVSLGLLMMFLALAILTGIPLSLQGAREPSPSSEGNGHWLYDAGGNHNGCASPGSDCTWSSK